MITITGLGPGDLDRLPSHVRAILADPGVTVFLRTIDHPAARQLAELRHVEPCDDLYDSEPTFEAVYAAIAARVIDHSEDGPVIYAVPGSPLVGESAVGLIISARPDAEVIPTESFVEAVLAEVGCDPLDRGLQILNAHDLPDPLILDKPTIIAQVDRPQILADTVAVIGTIVPEGTRTVVLSELGTREARRVEVSSEVVEPSLAGLRTTLFVDAEPGGLVGAIKTVRRLAVECPWDREQTHKTLVKNLVEETYELIDAILGLPDDDIDWTAYSRVEDELGDVLLQVLMHEAIGRDQGTLDINNIAEGLRQKLVRRHPHIYADVVVGSAEEVKANWDRIKADETNEAAGSALDGIPTGLPGLHLAGKIQNRAAKLGFDWEAAEQVIPKVVEEANEVAQAMGDPQAVFSEIGDLLFSVVNLARHLEVDPELALRSSIARFGARFRLMEAEGPLSGLTADQLEERWERAKGAV